MIGHLEYKGFSVYISVESIYVENLETGAWQPTDRFSAAYTIGEPAAGFNGQYIRENKKKVKSFSTVSEAYAEAARTAREKVDKMPLRPPPSD